MIYNFQLHRITLILIVALLGVGGGLLFFSGLLVGVSWQLPKAAPGGTLAATGDAALDGPEAERREVALPDGFTSPAATVPAFKAPAVTAPAVTAPELVMPAYAPPSYSPPAAPAVTPASAPAAAPLPLSPDAVHFPESGGPAPGAEDAPAAAPSPVPAAPRADPLRSLRPEQPQTGFALQVGAFSQNENTQKLLQDLAARGFEPYVVRTATRSSQHVESVRIGHFTSRSEAAAASSELARAEGIRAFVVRASGIVP